ncbi:MAG: hypothetical protein H6740_19455 [Alphaproteobacteria bacterium]|nr:hypothetical protein [Alphaproteobacteria bacterium]
MLINMFEGPAGARLGVWFGMLRAQRWSQVLVLLACGCRGAEPPPALDAALWSLAEPHPCPAEVPADDAIFQVLDTLGVAREDFGVPRARFDEQGGRVASDPARRSWFHPAIEDMPQLSCTAGNLARRSDLALDGAWPLTELIADAAGALDLRIQVGGAWPEPPKRDALAQALDALDASYDPAALEDVPEEVAEAAALLLSLVPEAVSLREEGLSELLPGGDREAAFLGLPNLWLPSVDPILEPEDPAYAPLFAPEDAGLGKLAEAAARLASALDAVDWEAVAAADAPFFLRAETRYGLVLLSGGQDDVWDPAADPALAEGVLLLLDTGGDDTSLHGAGATAWAGQPLALHVDLAGDDVYTYAEVPDAGDREGLLPADADGRYTNTDYGPYSLSRTPRQGAGLLGVGMLLDLGGGQDVYRSHRMSQGFGAGGVGVLWDDGGDDSYTLEDGGQGAASGGIGLLVDLEGVEHYRAFRAAQGMGWVAGFGAALDGGGGDLWELVVDEVVLFPSSQVQGEANLSFGQGAGYGLRRDDTGAHLSGGVGLLRDRAGDDRYLASVYAQGAAYWMGLGVAADASGDDQWDGLFYTTGAGVHWAMGVALDAEGDDRWGQSLEAWQSVLGLGHDLGVGLVVDGEGADTWTGPDRSLGAGKCHGLGLMVEWSGDDSYVARRRSQGWATDYDGRVGSCGDTTDVPTYGVFVDLDGVDSYDHAGSDLFGDGAQWVTEDPDDEDALELSGGADVSGGAAFALGYGG